MSTLIRFTTRQRTLLPAMARQPMLWERIVPLIDRLQVLAMIHPLAADVCLEILDRFLTNTGAPQKGGSR